MKEAVENSTRSSQRNKANDSRFRGAIDKKQDLVYCGVPTPFSSDSNLGLFRDWITAFRWKTEQGYRSMKKFWILASLAVFPFGYTASAETGEIGDLFAIDANRGGLTPPPPANDRFGNSAADLGDLDGDGIREVAVGASFAGPGGEGEVHILFRDASGRVNHEQRIGAFIGGFNFPLSNGDFFGTALAAIGDIDGDGVPDLAVGSPSPSAGKGKVWLLLLNSDGTVRSFQAIGDGSGGFGGSLQFRDSFGASVACLGDLDGDGFVELAIGASGTNNQMGATWIVSIDPNGARSELLLNSPSGGFGGTLQVTGLFGYSVANLGDLDGDNIPELVVGTSPAVQMTEEVWVLFLNANGTVKSEVELSVASDPSLAATIGPDVGFGVALTGIGDLDGDGVPDVAVGAPEFDGTTDLDVGAILFLFLQANGTIKSVQVVSEADPLVAQELTPNSNFGRGLAQIQDPFQPWLVAGIYTEEAVNSNGALLNMRVCKGGLEADFQADVNAGSFPLTVSMDNLTSGGLATSWMWDFGDGTTSTDESPTHVYASIGTFDVMLSAAGPGTYCSEFKAAFIVTSQPGIVSVRNGSGVNPDVYRDLTLPEIGSNWLTQVDGTLMGWTGLSILFAYEDELTGLPTAFGELLVDVTSPFSALQVGAFSGGIATHTLAIPNDTTLIGTTFSVQAFANGAGQLTNALDILVGVGI